jgi:uncharacterized protein with ATP-grasp and redox domains
MHKKVITLTLLTLIVSTQAMCSNAKQKKQDLSKTQSPLTQEQKLANEMASRQFEIIKKNTEQTAKIIAPPRKQKSI